jgi:alanine dehydrogenase
MKVGVPKEVKLQEHRVGLVPASVRELVGSGHTVFIQRGAGTAIGFTDGVFASVGATMVETAEEVFALADLIVKVKEPQFEEYRLLRRGQVLFTYLHLAPDPKQAAALLEAGCTAIAYETVTGRNGVLPLLAPMSEVAGRMAIQVGALCLEVRHGGAGVLLGGVPGVPPARVVVLGGGVAGTNAARIASGIEATVTVVDKSVEKLRQIDERFGSRLRTAFATVDAIESLVSEADLIVGAALVPGALAPKLVNRRMLKTMKRGSALVDISIDQGGCFETSRPTTHAEPTYIVDGIVHYCVANMPGAVARTSTLALNNATLPYVLAIANKGWRKACAEDRGLLDGLNVHEGTVTHAAVAEAVKLPYRPTDTLVS